MDTTYLPEDLYKKCGPILNSLKGYENLLLPLRGRKLNKSKKVFDNSKITDHHAIIPTGMKLPDSLSKRELEVFNLIALRFISVFYPDFSFLQTIVSAKCDKYNFKATGRQVTDIGWKAVYSCEHDTNDSAIDNDDTSVLPEFSKGETGSHSPFLLKKTTQSPKYYTEGTLLKAMETAGATVDDEDLREALKANGIGRPSTRAAIIEILYKRGYIIKERKSLKASPAAIDLMSVIKEDLLKSAKLTGIWEGKLRQIERGEYDAHKFIEEIKQMVTEITQSVIRDNSDRRIMTCSIPYKENKTTNTKTGRSNKKPAK